MFGAGPGGFGNAPVTKVLCAISVSSSLLLQAAHASRRPVPAYIAAFEHAFVFRHPGELIVGTGLLYYSRLYERQMGSAKYGGYILGTGVLSYLLELAATTALHVSVPSGPYGIIFANFVTFALTIPPLQHFKLFGKELTDKAFMYLAGSQLFFSSPHATIAAGVCGVLAGTAYHCNLLGMKALKLPKVANDILGRTLGPLLGTRRRQVVVPAAEAQQRAAASASAARQRPPRSQQTQAQRLPEASPQALEQLVAMGFDSGQAAQALRESANDVQGALAGLLG